MRRLLKIGLFLLPIFIIPLKINEYHINIRDARELLFQSLAIIALSIVIKNKWIRYFLCWVVFNWWFNYFLPPQSSVVLFNIFFGFFLFYLIKKFIDIKDIDGILKVICFTALFQVFWLGLQALGKDPIFYPITGAGYRGTGKPSMVGWMGNRNLLGAYLALCIPLFRVYYKKFIIFILIGLVISRSSLAITSAFAGLIIFEFFTALKYSNIIKFKRVGTIVLITIISIVCFFMFIDNFGFERVIIWKRLIAQSFNWRLLIGQGLGRYQTLKVFYNRTIWDNPHNEYLQVYFELGVVGLVLVFGYLIGLFKRFLRFRNEKTILLFSCITVLLVNCLGHFPFQIAPTAFLGLVYFALLERVLCQHRQDILSTN